MSTHKQFEDRVRATATLLWNRSAEQERVAGVNLDCVLKIDSGRWVIVEITEQSELDKVRTDINRLAMARLSLFTNQSIMSECIMVMQRQPTQAMVDAGKDVHVKVISFQKFERQLFDMPTYVSARKLMQFGSSINPLTGEADTSEYVPVVYTMGNGSSVDVKGISSLIKKGGKTILLGQYGSGKSRCLREVFSILTDDADSSGYYYLAIDLRKAWGLQTGVEIVRRHLEDVGLLSSADRLMRALNAGRVCFLLDGFDELGSQAWSNNSVKLQNIRYETLAGVRELIEKNSGGTLICGRDHYFNGEPEMFRSLAINPSSAHVVRCKEEFSDDEMDGFLDTLGLDVPVPEWLPKRPLMCQAIANLDQDDLHSMFVQDGGDVEFWHSFMNVVCVRESRIRSSLDPDTIFLVLQELSRATRVKPADVGPITLTEVQRAFEAVLGREPVEGASVMLQRLPGLGRTEAESDDRKFIDAYIVDGLRALDAVRCIREEDKFATKERWLNPLKILGQRLFAKEVKRDQMLHSCMRYAEKALYDGNSVLASDAVASLGRVGPDVDFNNFCLTDGHISTLDLSMCQPRRLVIQDSIIEELVFPSRAIDGISIKGSVIQKAVGISDRNGLPAWVSDTTVDTFDALPNTSSIKNSRLSVQHRILVTILKKTYFQKGAGRQEDALLRGLGQIDRHGYTDRILGYLVQQGILETAKGDHGTLYVPVMKNMRRVGAIRSELNMSTDSIWKWVGEL